MNKIVAPAPFLPSHGIAIVRIITGMLLIYHGWEVFDEEKMKGYGTWDQFKGAATSWLVYLGKIAELVSGILLTFGLLTKLASLLLTGTMCYIIFFIGHGKIWYEDQHPFLFVLLGMVFFFTGPGRWSLDHLFFDRKIKIT